jgi:hypothetical protein
MIAVRARVLGAVKQETVMPTKKKAGAKGATDVDSITAKE